MRCRRLWIAPSRKQVGIRPGIGDWGRWLVIKLCRGEAGCSQINALSLFILTRQFNNLRREFAGISSTLGQASKQ